MQINVVERAQQIQVQEQEIVRRERELNSQVKKPADAEKFKLERLAEANRVKVVMEAEAEAKTIQVSQGHNGGQDYTGANPGTRSC